MNLGKNFLVILYLFILFLIRFGEYLYSDSRSHNPLYCRSTAIQLFGNDHYVTNTIVFSSLIGVEVRGAANLLVGVHTWNMASEDGGIGIYMNCPGYTQNRVIGCYLDWNSLVYLFIFIFSFLLF